MSFEWGKIVKNINWTLIFNLINFGILLYILRRLLFKPAIEYLDRRREQIASHMSAAREAEEHAAKLAEEREQQLAAARMQSENILEDARRRTEEMIDEAKEQARREGVRIIDNARLQMEQERDRMIKELRRAYADIAVLGVERVLDREVKLEDHRRLLDQLLEEIDETSIAS